MNNILLTALCTLAALPASGAYNFLYTETGTDPVIDPTVNFTSSDDYTDKSGSRRHAYLLVKEVPATFTGTCYWNVQEESATAPLLTTPGKVAFSSKKTAVTWLRVAVLDDASVESTAASSAGFRAIGGGSSVLMTPGDDYHTTATVTFNNDKSFEIHYGSVNSQSDMGAVTGIIPVSERCTEAVIDYDFLHNNVSFTETAWADPEPVEPVELSDADRARCFADNETDRTVTFIFDPALWKVTPSKVEVRGSFNGWASGTYALAYNETAKAWTVTVPYNVVKVPGNSGQPEFKFVVNGNYMDGSSRSFIPEGYVFRNGDNNNIVVFSTDDFETIKANSATANVLKTADDFDLTTRAGQEEISNFRLVPGTRRLFRSYHPYKITKITNPTEPLRMKYLTQLAEEEGIRSDICLSENEENNLNSFNIAGTPYQETIPEYYADIINRGCVLYTGTANGHTPSYNKVYYNPTGTRFSQWIKEVVDFINSDKTEAPYLIHCRLGTDRTGVFCATLAALCGSEWDAIAADYQLTNRMGVKEFRDYHLLQYAFQLLLGVEDIKDVPSVSEGIRKFFIDNGTLTNNDIDALRLKLNAMPTGIETTAVTGNPETVKVEYFDLSGRHINTPAQRICIRRATMSDGSVVTEKTVN